MTDKSTKLIVITPPKTKLSFSNSEINKVQQQIQEVSTSKPNISREEIERIKNREIQRKHVQKVKPYAKLATIQNPIDQIIALIKLQNPELESISQTTLLIEVCQFIEKLKNLK